MIISWSINKAWRSDGFGAALAAAMQLWALGLGSIVIAGLYCSLTRRWPRKWEENPTLSDILLALISASAIFYWIREFESPELPGRS